MIGKSFPSLYGFIIINVCVNTVTNKGSVDEKKKKFYNFICGRRAGPAAPQFNMRGRSSSVEHELPKLERRVRFPSPAPIDKLLHSRCGGVLFFREPMV